MVASSRERDGRGHYWVDGRIRNICRSEQALHIAGAGLALAFLRQSTAPRLG